MSIFKYLDYTDVLRWKLKENRSTYGYKSRLAGAGGFQASLLSQVLARKTDISLDHAIGLAEFWYLTELEKDYFLNLVSWARAGNPKLKAHLKAKIDHLRKDSESLSRRFDVSEISSKESHAATYYSAWYMSALHILVTIPAFQEIGALARRLKLSPATIETGLHALRQMGLVENQGARWTATQAHVHLSKGSPLSILHHHHWRTKSIAAFSEEGMLIPYSSLYSISREDLEKLKDMMFSFIQETRGLAEKSNPEELVCIICDLFQV